MCKKKEKVGKVGLQESLINYDKKKVHTWKTFAKLKSAKNWQKLSVAQRSLTPSGTSGTKLFRILPFSE